MSETATTFKAGDRVIHLNHLPSLPRGYVATLDGVTAKGVRLLDADGDWHLRPAHEWELARVANTENPKAAFGNLKTPALSVIPSPPLLQVGEVMRRGAEKYGAYNWRESRVNTSTYIDAVMRHLMSYQDGETIDPDDGQSHLAHAAASLFVIMDALAVGNATDDRPKPGVAAEFIAATAAKRTAK